MRKFKQNPNAVLVGSFPPVGRAREFCELHDSPGCQDLTCTMCVRAPAGVVQACPAPGPPPHRGAR